jgi:CBS domain-containing protein
VFDGWIRNNDPEALLNASIFFDFRPIYGAPGLAGELRDSVLRQTKANRTFLRALADTTLRVRPPLGLISDFTEDELDLKALGARPFVDAARVLALAAGSPETATAARLRGAGENTAVAAFHFIQGLRLRAQGNRVRVRELNDIDRRVLKEAFRQAVMLQERVRLDYQL